MEHTFVRWDDPDGERLNVEATSKGLNSYSDEYYRQWPRRLTQRELNTGMYLRALSPREELGLMFGQRGSCWRDNRNFGAALESYYWAQQVAPMYRPHAGRRAVTTIMFFHAEGTHDYGLDRASPCDYVVDDGNRRPLDAWEQWAVPIAHREWRRLRIIHGEIPAPDKPPRRKAKTRRRVARRGKRQRKQK